jgi:APA family basic amino acid/polyamine antiporter
MGMVSLMSLFRTKPITSNSPSSLHRCLTALDLTLLGIGAIVGAGVFVLTGIAAATKAGPAISVSYIIAGLAALFSALSYAEMSASVGGCGSAYNYAYAAFGELIAWIIGWALLLEYSISVSSVAIGWSGYVNDALLAMHMGMPKEIISNPGAGGWINLPAALMIIVLSVLLCLGVKSSVRFNAIIVCIKLIAISIFIGVAIFNIHPSNWHPFSPFGWHGITQGAAIIFFAYIGFDAVSTAAEETINPQRNLPIGIITSVIICTLIYMLVAILLTGITHYSTLNVASPVANALLNIGYPLAGSIVAVGAIAGLTTVMLVMFYGLTRIVLAMSRDGLLPPLFSTIHTRSLTPVPAIIITGIIMAAIAGFVPLDEAAALVNIGTLSAFTLVCCGVIAMRILHPDLPRPFKLPLNPLIPLLGVLFCLYLMFNLSMTTWVFFSIWLVIGLVIYFTYSKKHSTLK